MEIWGVNMSNGLTVTTTLGNHLSNEFNQVVK